MDPDQQFQPGAQINPPPDSGAYSVPTVPPSPSTMTMPPNHAKHLFSLPMVLASLMLVLAVGLGIVAITYISKYHKEKTTVEAQVAAAAQAAREAQKTADEKDFIEREKSPLRNYRVPTILGHIVVEFPKTWNVYAIENAKSTTQLDVFMSPQVVRAAETLETADPYALRIKLEDKLYPDAIQTYKEMVKTGTLTAQAIKVSGIVGTKFAGEITNQHSGTLVLLPLRDKTLSIWTESDNYLKDFEQVISKISVSP